ncbi:MAG: exodeoxyribonuclease VII large subunit [Patescibacteria group bacterium]
MSDQPIFSVSEFVQTLKVHLGRLGEVVVEGEVADFRGFSRETLVFFEIKDEGSRLRCFMLAHELDCDLADGLAVRVTGTPSVFVKNGGLHLRVNKIELVGQGALQQALEKTKKKLEAEGLFATERKRTLPAYPERIGLITSADAAARTDVLRVLKNRWPFATIVFFPVGVQGSGAIASIVGALERCIHYDLDAVILTRGGGSLEDLQAFNSELVARAMFSCTVPIVCGVGHERDWTIADLVADVRAATPSNAAELVSPDIGQVQMNIDMLAGFFDDGWRQLLGELHDRLHHLTRDLADVVQGTVQRVISLRQQLLQAFIFALERTRTDLFNAAKLVQTLSPTATLERGYSLTMVGNTVVKDAASVKKGSRLHTRLKRGTIDSTVT